MIGNGMSSPSGDQESLTEQSDQSSQEPSSLSDGQSESSTRRDAPQPRNERDRLREALAGPPEGDEAPDGVADPEGVEQQQGAQDEGSPAKSEPLTPASIAEKLEIDQTEFYRDFQVPTGDGEAVSIQQLKDHWTNRQEAERVSAEKTSQIEGREAELVQELQKLRVLKEAGLPPKAAQAAQQVLTDRLRKETEWFLTLAPELRDPTVLEGFRQEAIGAMKEVGIRPADMQAVMSHHGAGLLMRKLLKTQKQLATMTEQNRPKPPRSVKPTHKGKSSSQAKARMDAARSATTPRGKISAALGKPKRP